MSASGVLAEPQCQFRQSTTMSLAIKLQSASSDFQKLQSDMTRAVEARQKLEAQLSENELVKKVRISHIPSDWWGSPNSISSRSLKI